MKKGQLRMPFAARKGPAGAMQKTFPCLESKECLTNWAEYVIMIMRVSFRYKKGRA